MCWYSSRHWTKTDFRADADGDLEVFGPNEWRGGARRRARQCGTLIDASRYPDHFMEVMEKWLERNSDARRKSANARFSGCFPGASDRVIEDGIVSAANTFDLLPNEDKPDVGAAARTTSWIFSRMQARRRGAVCLPGAQRDDVLDALGRIRSDKRLRHIVEHRAEIVLDHFCGDRLKQLKKVIGLAVKCRNYYTHGPGDQRDPGDVDYADFGSRPFPYGNPGVHLRRFGASALRMGSRLGR